MTAANYLGLSRIALAPIAAICLIHGTPRSKYVTVVVVVLAIATDVLDGVVARRLGTVSTFGVFLDLTADKVFICPILFLIAANNKSLLALAVIVTMREFLIMGVRAYAASAQVVIPARRYGKLKAIVMYPALILVLLEAPAANWVLLTSVIIAVISAGDYLRRAWPLVARGLHNR